MQKPNSTPRLLILKGLCVFSTVSGIAWIMMLVFLLVSRNSQQNIRGLVPDLALQYLNPGIYFVILLILLATGAIMGLVLIWKQKKSGFYIYSMLKMMIFFLPVLVLGNDHLNYPGLFLTAAPIFLYGVLLSVFSG